MSKHQSDAFTGGGSSAQVTTARSSGAETDALGAALADMTASFSTDFADGRIGQRHNTFGHRSRVLRQMAGQLATMREQNAVTAL